MAKNSEAKKSATKTASKGTEMSYAERKSKAAEKVKAQFGGLVNHTATVTGGRKFPEGTVVDVNWVGVNKFFGQTAKITVNGETAWIDPKFLKKGKPLSDAKVAAYEAEREAESEATVLIPATVALERDENGKSSVLLNYTGWFKGMWFSKAMVEKTGGKTPSGIEVFRIPAWKVKQERGQDALDALLAKQAGFEAMVAEAEAA